MLHYNSQVLAVSARFLVLRVTGRFDPYVSAVLTQCSVTDVHRSLLLDTCVMIVYFGQSLFRILKVYEIKTIRQIS